MNRNNFNFLSPKVPILFNPFIEKGILHAGIDKAFIKTIHVNMNEFKKGFLNYNDLDYELLVTPMIRYCFLKQRPEYIKCVVSFQELAEYCSNKYKRRAIARQFVEQKNSYLSNTDFIENTEKAGF